MKVRVRLGEPFWRAVGKRDLELEIPKQTCVGELLASLCQQFPALEQELQEAPPMVFIGEDEANQETVIPAGSRVHLVWAVAGG